MKLRLLLFSILLLLPFTLQAQHADKKIEFGVELGAGSVVSTPRSVYGGLWAGRRFNGRVAAGMGLDYVSYFNATLPSKAYMKVKGQHAFRPFAYGRFDILPEGKICPFVGLRAGYGLFSDGRVAYDYSGVNIDMIPDAGGPIPEDKHLGIRGACFGALEFGASRRLGRARLGAALTCELQPVSYTYIAKTEKTTLSSVGAKLVLSF